MGILDKVKETATKVGEKAKEVGETGKEKVEGLQLKRKIEALEREIGELIVRQRRGEAPADLETQIDHRVALITDAEQQIADGGTGADDDAADEPPAG